MKNKQVQINLDPTLKGLDNIQLLSDQMQFKMLAITGNTAQQYLISPIHAKRIHLLFKKNIEEYEKRYGEIETSLPEVDKSETSEKRIGFQQE